MEGGQQAVNIYSSPEKYGLTACGEIDWFGAADEFNLMVVWYRADHGVYVYGEDTGSLHSVPAPEPFEHFGVDDLTPINSLGEFHTLLIERMAQRPNRNNDDVVRLLGRLYEDGLR
jgi:hypothetical protein